MTAATAQRRAEELRDGLRRERKVYERLLEVARRQQEVLVSGRTDEILELARNKEQELETIDDIEVGPAPLKAEWSRLRTLVGDDLCEDVDGELEQLQDVLKTLIELEMEGQRSVDRMRADTADQLRQVEGGRRMHRAYKRGEPPPRYLDRSR